MLKINNHGWGLSTFISFIVVFGIAITLVIVGAIRLGISSDDKLSTLPVTNINSPSVSDTSHDDQVNDYIKQLKDVSLAYVRDNSLVIKDNDSVIITVVHLVKENYISKMQFHGEVCTGYVMIKMEKHKLVYYPFLNCGNGIVTEKYDSNIDEKF